MSASLLPICLTTRARKVWFEQVHLARRFGASNLVITPFFVDFDAEFGSPFARIVSQLPTIRPEPCFRFLPAPDSES